MKRSLGLSDVFAVSAGAMLSSGFFLLPGLAMGETGPSLVVAYALAALLILPPMASMAELATAMPKSGGAYFLLDQVFGRLVGTVAGIGTWVQLLLKSSFALVGVGAYLSLFLDVSVQPLAIALTIVFAAVNLRGAAETGLVQRLLVYLVVGILAFYILQGGFYVATDVGREGLGQSFSPFMTQGFAGLFGATGMLFVAFTGLTKVASIAEEIRSPGRNIPRGMALAWVVVTLIYILGSGLVVAVMQADALVESEAPIATAGEEFLGWLPLTLGMALITVSALAAFLSTANAGLMSAGRYGLALGRDDVVPGQLAKVGSRGTPSRSLILSAGGMIVAILLLDLEMLAKMASAFQLLVFAFLCGAVIVAREAKRSEYSPGFRSPFYPYLQIFGFIASLALIPLMGLDAILTVLVAVAIGSVWYFLHARRASRQPPLIEQVLSRRPKA